VFNPGGLGIIPLDKFCCHQTYSKQGGKRWQSLNLGYIGIPALKNTMTHFPVLTGSGEQIVIVT